MLLGMRILGIIQQSIGSQLDSQFQERPGLYHAAMGWEVYGTTRTRTLKMRATGNNIMYESFYALRFHEIELCSSSSKADFLIRSPPEATRGKWRPYLL
jgi:hypothetical protein